MASEPESAISERRLMKLRSGCALHSKRDTRPDAEMSSMDFLNTSASLSATTFAYHEATERSLEASQPIAMLSRRRR